MSLHTPGAVARELATRGYNAERGAVERIVDASDPPSLLERVVRSTDRGTVRITTEDVNAVIDGEADASGTAPGQPPTMPPGTDDRRTPDEAPVSPSSTSPDETKGGSTTAVATAGEGVHTTAASTETPSRAPSTPTISGDVTGESTCTGEYTDFVRLFRDRYDRLGRLLKRRVDHRPAGSLESVPGGTDVSLVGLVNDIRTTAGGHRLVELEDTSGMFPCLVTTDRDLPVEDLLLDEVVAVEGTLADDGGVLFANELRYPDVPRRYDATSADRAVSAALISDIHVGSEEFVSDAWERFAAWLHTPEAGDVEYLLIAGDMVEGVGVYPDQDEDLAIIDIYDQYEAFNERLKSVPGDMEIVMIPGNHDAVRLAEPQPGFREDLREIMSAHDARIVGNPSTITIEDVSILLYHGVSLDEVIARIPTASYDRPAEAMTALLRKRHLAPTYGGRTQIAPEHRDYLVIDEIPDVFHAGHVHTLGVTDYHGVTVVNSGCWQAQTDFQRRNNIEPDYGYAPILDLETLSVTLRKFI